MARKPRHWVIAGLHVWQDLMDKDHCWWVGHDGHRWHWYKGLLCDEGPRGANHWEQWEGAPPMTLDAAVGFTVGYGIGRKEAVSELAEPPPN